MEEQMNYILMPSLKQRALIKTATMLWSQDDVRAFIAEFDFKLFEFNKRQKEWQVVEDKVTEKVQVLPLPEYLKNKVSAFIKQICLEVLKWRDCRDHFHFGERFIKEHLHKICWTPQGTVDKKKTAEAIIRDENLRIATRYQIACIYCLKNDILMLWNKMPENDRKYFYSEGNPVYVFQHPSVVLWTYDVKGEMTRMENFTRTSYGCTPYQYALQEAVLEGNQVATEYFLQKLSSEEREEWLVRSATKLCTKTSYYNYIHADVYSLYSHADVLCFLLSQMNEVKQIEVLKKYPLKVLSCLLYWPWQDFFMKMAKHVWAFLPRNDFNYLLRQIIRRVEDGFKDYDYKYLFREFWQQSPIAHRENIDGLLCDVFVGYILDLLEIKDRGNIKLILKDVTAPDREKVILSTCRRLAYNYEMDSLEFFVQECLTIKDIKIKFREELENVLIFFCSKETRGKGKDMWSKGFQLLNYLNHKCYNERCVEDENNGPAKRFCS